MTGPRLSTRNPRNRRGRRLLPFLLAVSLTPLGCSSDQPTEPLQPTNSGNVVAATGSHPRPRIAGYHAAKPSTAHPSALKVAASYSVASSVSSTGPSVLILADTDVTATTALANSLGAAGLQVTVRSAPEYTWDGTNPGLSGFDVVIHLNGETYYAALPSSAQTALTDFVQSGGGFIGAQWDGYEVQPELSNLVLQGMGGDPQGPEQNCGGCQVTYVKLPAGEGHPVMAGIPASFSFAADGHDAGPQVTFASEPSTVLMQVSTGGPAVLVRQFGAGRVVNFSFAPNYPFNDVGDLSDPRTLLNGDIQQLYLNAVKWAAGSGSAVAQSQTITFGALVDKTYGDAPFSINASASSNLPVSLTASGNCSVLGTTVTITAAGSCTLTAHQAGNDEFTAAEDVSQSFTIGKGSATLTLLGTATTFDGTAKAVTAVSNPSGLSGISISYSQGGSAVTPLNAGVYQVLATLDNPNYQAPQLSGTLTIDQATPILHWSPAPLSAGAALGYAQLNAVATGLGNVILGGTWLYDPAFGAVLPTGAATLRVTFTPSNSNYAQISGTASITVGSAMSFTGFFAPINNMPSLNSANAGSAIPVKFTLTGYSGGQMLKAGSPSSTPVQCNAGAAETGPAVGNVGTLQSVRSSYTYVWKTNASWAGSCRKFVLTLADGSTHKALFRFAPAAKAHAGKRK
jgi:MBG domain/Trehalose utilisation